MTDTTHDWYYYYPEGREAYEARMERIKAKGLPVRENMIVNADCYPCGGTGFVIGFGSTGSECLHHAVDCEPQSRCYAPCEHAEDDEEDEGPGQCIDCGTIIPAHNNPPTCTDCRIASSRAARKVAGGAA